MFDPNSTITQAHEVRVTMRGVRLSPDGAPVQVSTRSDFIAPDLSAPALVALELDKGKRGWSNYDVKPEVVTNGGIVSGGSNPYSARVTVGLTVIRKAPTTGLRVAHRTGPRPNRGK